jgi:hypothetical protein
MAAKKPKAATTETTTKTEPDEVATYYTLPLSDPAGARFQVDLLFYDLAEAVGEEEARKYFREGATKRRAQQFRNSKLLQRLDSMKPRPTPYRLARAIAKGKYGEDATPQQIASIRQQIVRLRDKRKKNASRRPIKKVAMRIQIK